MLVIGTDEAGYGPNLGPLVVSATAWSVPPKVDLTELGKTLREQGIDIADSKQLYHGGGSLKTLEHGVWIAHLSADKTKISVEMDSDDPCWQDGFFDKLVAETSWRDVHKLADVLLSTLESVGVRLLRLRSFIVGAKSFNQRLDACGSKGTLLSEVTLEIVRDFFTETPEYRLSDSEYRLNGGIVLCDKHGGRNRYLDILTRFFPDEFFLIVEESRPLSVYRSKELEFRFQSKGESQLPVALASMLSKYLREISMLKFNAFWRSHLPDLKPTAGYPEDAKRFKADIAAVQARLGISDNLIWRKK